MKIFAFILSLYILVLTAIPCIDETQDNTLHKIELSQNTTGNHQNDTDHCSPFCVCYCCISPIIYQAYTIRFNCFSFTQKHYPGYKTIYISSFYSSVWQPPELI